MSLTMSLHFSETHVGENRAWKAVCWLPIFHATVGISFAPYWVDAPISCRLLLPLAQRKGGLKLPRIGFNLTIGIIFLMDEPE